MNLIKHYLYTKVLTMDTKESLKRAEEFNNRMKKSGLDNNFYHTFVFGLNGKKDKIPNFLLKDRWFTDLVHLNGTKAVCYSHFMAWMDCMNIASLSEEEVCFIIEDDVHIHPKFMEYLNDIDVPDDFDFVHFSYWDPKCGIRNQKKVSKHVAKIVNPCCTGMFSYAIRPRALFEKMDLIVPFGEEIDNHIMKQTLAGKINTYVIEHQPWLTQEISEVSLRKEADDASWAKANEPDSGD